MNKSESTPDNKFPDQPPKIWVGAIHISHPLRPDCTVQLTLPENLSIGEGARLAAFISRIAQKSREEDAVQRDFIRSISQLQKRHE